MSNGSVRAESLNKTKNNLSSKNSIHFDLLLVSSISKRVFFFTLSGQLRHNKAIFNALFLTLSGQLRHNKAIFNAL